MKDLTELQHETMGKCHEYYESLTEETGKKGYIWLKNDETGQLMIYTRGEYTDQLMEFLKTLK